MAVVRDQRCGGNYRFFDTEKEALAHAELKAEAHSDCEYYVLKATAMLTREPTPVPVVPPVVKTRL